MPKTPTHVLLNQITLAASASSVSFSNIPQNYADLVIVISGISSAGTSPSLNFNGDGGSNYNNIRMYASAAGFNAQAFTDSYGSIGFMTTQQTSIRVQIFDYSAIDKHKLAVGRGGNTDTIRFEATRWANTSAITSVTVRMDGSQTYNTGTTISIYGVYA